MTEARGGAVTRAPRPSSLADVLDLILDKGLVIDAYVRVSLAGIELLTIDARVVVASVDTYLRFAEAVNRLDLTATEERGIDALTRARNGGDDDSGRDDERDNQNGKSRQAGDESRKEVHAGKRPSDGDEAEEPGLIGRIAERAKFER